MATLVDLRDTLPRPGLAPVPHFACFRTFWFVVRRGSVELTLAPVLEAGGPAMSGGVEDLP